MSFSSFSNLDRKVLRESTQNNDENLMYTLERKPQGFFRTDYNGLFNDRYMAREDDIRQMVDKRCRLSAEKGYLCRRDRIRMGQDYGDIKTLQFETPSGYLNSEDIARSMYGNLAGIGWGKCPGNPGDSGCARNTSTSSLVSAAGNSCQKTSSQQLKNPAKNYNGQTPVFCEDSVGHASNYFRLRDRAAYGKFLKDNVDMLEKEEEENLS